MLWLQPSVLQFIQDLLPVDHFFIDSRSHVITYKGKHEGGTSNIITSLNWKTVPLLP